MLEFFYFQRRALMIALQVCAPYLLQSAIKKFELLLQSSSSLPIIPSRRKLFLDLIPLVQKSIYIIHRLHLAIFYLQGLFYHPAKRLLGIQYVSLFEKWIFSWFISDVFVLGFSSHIVSNLSFPWCMPIFC